MKTILQIEGVSKEELLSFIEQSINRTLAARERDLETKGTLTVQEASKLLNCADITVHSYIKKGLLPAKKLGRKYIIKEKDLEGVLSEVKSLKYKRD